MTKVDIPQWPVRAVVNLSAYRENLAQMRRFAPHCQQMAIVKANAYGHGIERMALAALDAGAEWLGVAKASEAFQLRKYLDKQGVARDHLVDTPTSAMMRSRLYQIAAMGLPTAARPRILTWLYAPQTDLQQVVKAEIDISVSTLDQLDQVSRACDAAGLRCRVHLKVDTGLCRAGATNQDFPVLCKLARARERAGLIEISAIWSHLARADEDTAAAESFTKSQLSTFEWAWEVAQEAGLRPKLRHIAATAGIIWYPESHYDLVRVGISGYGLSPNPEIASSWQLGVRPVMRLETNVVQVKRVEKGAAVSYGGEWVAPGPRWLGLLPIGYADGLHRLAKNRGETWIKGQLAPIVGRIPMDQIVVDLGPAVDDSGDPVPCPIEPGELAIIFGDAKDRLFGGIPGVPSLPTADDWAEWTDTINYEVITGISPNVPRVYVEDQPDC